MPTRYRRRRYVSFAGSNLYLRRLENPRYGFYYPAQTKIAIDCAPACEFQKVYYGLTVEELDKVRSCFQASKESSNARLFGHLQEQQRRAEESLIYGHDVVGT